MIAGVSITAPRLVLTTSASGRMVARVEQMTTLGRQRTIVNPQSLSSGAGPVKTLANPQSAGA